MTDILERWDAQQEAYIADRERRFDMIVEIVARVAGPQARVLDLACGPGSLSARILDRLPEAQVVGLDFDPALLKIASSSLSEYQQRLQLVETDLLGDAWTDLVSEAAAGPFDAIVSTTALHWLTPDQLLRVYSQAAQLLPAGGMIANADHLHFDSKQHPTLARVADEHDRQTQQAGFTAGAPDWDAWWDDLSKQPEYAELVAERNRRFDGRHDVASTTIEFHVMALRQAGFSEVAPIWQLLDDYVVFGRINQ